MHYIGLMKPIYKKALYIGIALGLFASTIFSLFDEPDEMIIPGWRGTSDFGIDFGHFKLAASSQILDLQHRALLLRFCALFVERGFLIMATTTGVALFIAFLEECAEKNVFLSSLRRAIKLVGKIYLGYWLFLCCPVLLLQELCHFRCVEESLLIFLWYFFVSSLYGIFVFPVFLFFTYIIHLFLTFIRLKPKEEVSEIQE